MSSCPSGMSASMCSSSHTAYDAPLADLKILHCVLQGNKYWKLVVASILYAVWLASGTAADMWPQMAAGRLCRALPGTWTGTAGTQACLKSACHATLCAVATLCAESSNLRPVSLGPQCCHQCAPDTVGVGLTSAVVLVLLSEV